MKYSGDDKVNNWGRDGGGSPLIGWLLFIVGFFFMDYLHFRVRRGRSGGFLVGGGRGVFGRGGSRWISGRRGGLGLG